MVIPQGAPKLKRCACGGRPENVGIVKLPDGEMKDAVLPWSSCRRSLQSRRHYAHSHNLSGNSFKVFPSSRESSSPIARYFCYAFRSAHEECLRKPRMLARARMT